MSKTVGHTVGSQSKRKYSEKESFLAAPLDAIVYWFLKYLVTKFGED